MSSALTTSTVRGVSLTTKRTRTPCKAVSRVVCKASLEKEVKKIVAAGAAAPVLLSANPVFAAYVEDRMNGDGTGQILGINNSGVGWAVLLTFSLVWIFYFISQKDLGGDDNDESGLTL